MQPEAILELSDIMRAYFSDSELADLANLFDIQLEYENFQPSYLRTARALGERVEFGNNRRFIQAVVDQAFSRCKGKIAQTKWQERDYHEQMLNRIYDLRSTLGDAEFPTEITVPEDHPFTAKSKAREFLEKAETDILIVDPYIGVGTLDCLRGVEHSIRILTGTKKNSVESGFSTSVDQFRVEGKKIEIRSHTKLHDRYLVFNDRCWLIGSSLKDAGKKTFSVIELVDGKSTIVSEIERKWSESSPIQ